MASRARLYFKNNVNPSIEHSDDARPNLGLCLSGGGSRAFTCGWGQLLGLKELQVLNEFRYVSSVSGGTWVSTLFCFANREINDERLLGRYCPPENLSWNGDGGKFNLNDIPEHCLGSIPTKMSLFELLVHAATFSFLHRNNPSQYKWLWGSLVSHYILKPFKLSNVDQFSWQSDFSYSLSYSYAETQLASGGVAIHEMHFPRENRPFWIANYNLMKLNPENGCTLEIPCQSTPVSSGRNGIDMPEYNVMGGSVESFAFNSTVVDLPLADNLATVEFHKPHSLIDTVSTSSAFFASLVTMELQKALADDTQRKHLVNEVNVALPDAHKQSLLQIFGKDLKREIEAQLLHWLEHQLEDFEQFIPSYNYWPVVTPVQNMPWKYADGGASDNTGILGLLAQTEVADGIAPPLYIVSFDNGSTPIDKCSSGMILAADQLAPLFGLMFDKNRGEFRQYNVAEKDFSNASFNSQSTLWIFDNSSVNDSSETPFEKIVGSLFAAWQSGQAATCQISLTTVGNPLAGVSAGRQVNLLYLQNASMGQWEDQLTDARLKGSLVKGRQPEQSEFEEFSHFPYLNTLTKIGLTKREANALSQMWAWAVTGKNSQASGVIQDFIQTARKSKAYD